MLKLFFLIFTSSAICDKFNIATNDSVSIQKQLPNDSLSIQKQPPSNISLIQKQFPNISLPIQKELTNNSIPIEKQLGNNSLPIQKHLPNSSLPIQEQLANDSLPMQKQLANNSLLIQKMLHRSFGHESYVQKEIQQAHLLLKSLYTVSSSYPPHFLDKIYSYWTMLQKSTLFPTPTIPEYIEPTGTQETYGYLGPGFKISTPKLPTHPFYSPSETYETHFWPPDIGKGTFHTWATWFKPLKTNATTKYTTRTLRPDTLTNPITKSTTTTELTYNPIKGWYDKQLTNTKYWLFSYTKFKLNTIAATISMPETSMIYKLFKRQFLNTRKENQMDFLRLKEDEQYSIEDSEAGLDASITETSRSVYVPMRITKPSNNNGDLKTSIETNLEVHNQKTEWPDIQFRKPLNKLLRILDEFITTTTKSHHVMMLARPYNNMKDMIKYMRNMKMSSSRTIFKV